MATNLVLFTCINWILLQFLEVLWVDMSCLWKEKLFNFSLYSSYGKCPKISNTKLSDKMTYANSADPDQTAPSGAV